MTAIRPRDRLASRRHAGGHLSSRRGVEALATNPPPRSLRKGRSSAMNRSQSFLVIALLALLLALAPMAIADKGGGGHRGGGGTTGGSGSLTMVLVTKTADGLPHWGNTITFTLNTTITQPWVNLQCFQKGALVAQGWDGFFDGSLTGRTFGLYSGQWTSGAAQCTAYLTTPQWAVVGSTSFHVNA